MLGKMLHVISGMKDPSKLERLLAAVLARMVETQGVVYTSKQLTNASLVVTLGEEMADADGG